MPTEESAANEVAATEVAETQEAPSTRAPIKEWWWVFENEDSAKQVGSIVFDPENPKAKRFALGYANVKRVETDAKETRNDRVLEAFRSTAEMTGTEQRIVNPDAPEDQRITGTVEKWTAGNLEFEVTVLPNGRGEMGTQASCVLTAEHAVEETPAPDAEAPTDEAPAPAEVATDADTEADAAENGAVESPF